ncbi:MAG: hypothetical protein EBR02_09745, partial [Alphaproteobacteria bacterium]|nr:hypothetical protein [Alphaproteobacteria bacterium]
FLLYVPHDILISDDATKVAMRLSGDELVFLRGKPDGFDGQAWSRASGQDSAIKMSDMDEEMSAPNCTKTRCDVNLGGLHIVVQRKKNERDGLCDEVNGRVPDMVIAQDYLDRIPACQRVPYLFEKAFLQKNGAVAIRFVGGKPQVETVAGARGDRIWN